MNKYFFIAFIFTIAIVQNNLLGDHDLGYPWSEDASMEKQHEGVEGLKQAFIHIGGCGLFCEIYINELHEEHWEVEEDGEELEESIERELEKWREYSSLLVEYF